MPDASARANAGHMQHQETDLAQAVTHGDRDDPAMSRSDKGTSRRAAESDPPDDTPTRSPRETAAEPPGGTRQRLVESAIRLIHASSYGAVSVNDLCAAAGVRKGSFYHFFPTKRDLVLAAMDADWERHRTGLFEAAFAPDIPPLDRIRRFFELLAPWSADLAAWGTVVGCPFGNLGVEMATQDAVIRAKTREILGQMAGYFARAISEAREAGDCGEVDVQATANRVLAYMQGLFVLAKLENDPQVFARFGKAALELIGEKSPR